MVEVTRTYTVEVTREDGYWLADVPSVEGCHTFARNLTALERNTREAIALCLDLPQGAEQGLGLDWVITTGDSEVDKVAADLRRRRRALEQEASQLASDTALAAQGLKAAHWSVRDAAGLLGITPGRISQLT